MVGEHGKRARQEFITMGNYQIGTNTTRYKLILPDVYEAMCDRIDTLTAQVDAIGYRLAAVAAERDTLTAENAELRAEIDAADADGAAITESAAQAESHTGTPATSARPRNESTLPLAPHCSLWCRLITAGRQSNDDVW